jgi:hypothetical protein
MATSQTDADGIQRVAMTPNQNPVYDHANGAATNVAGATTVLTPPAGCEFAEIEAADDVWIRADGVNPVLPVNGATSAGVHFAADVPRVIPVTAGVAVKAIAVTGTVLVVAVPMKNRG